MQNSIQFYIFGYADYMKNAIEEIINRDDVNYFDLFIGKNILEKCMHRLFVSRYIRLLSQMVMPIWKNRYLNGKVITPQELPIFIMYEVNPLSNKVQWIRAMKKSHPRLKVAYIFTNIITEHNQWRMDLIKNHPELYDVVITFNKADAEKYGLLHLEGIFSRKIPSKEVYSKAEESDVYFCGLEKGRMNDIVTTYEALTEKGIFCNFHVIYAKETDRKYSDKIHYHDQLINNEEMLAGVMKAKCVLELMVDKTQPGSSLRMCEAVVYQKKLLTNNRFASEKPYYNEIQMQIFEDPKEIDGNFIKEETDINVFENPSVLSPVRMLTMIKEAVCYESV